MSKQAGYIYAYITNASALLPWKDGLRAGDGIGRIKIGQTNRNVDKRIQEQQTNNPHGLDAWTRVLIETNKRDDGSVITDKAVLQTLREAGVHIVGKSEWAEATVTEIKRCIDSVKKRTPFSLKESRGNFPLRPEQEEAIRVTLNRFREQRSAGIPCSMLWNAKMRFGKSFAAIKLAQAVNAKRVLVLTWFPSVSPEWFDCVTGHVDFERWNWTHDIADPVTVATPSVHFVSAQGLFHTGKYGEVRRQNISSVKWDLLIVDEQHWGADKVRGREQVTNLDLHANHRLELSGTPFGDLESGYFSSEDTYSWSYTDEQQAKREWEVKHEDDPLTNELAEHQDHPLNPWHGMPRMEWRVFDLAEILGPQIEADETWTLSEMFAVDGDAFVHADLVKKWLATISRKTGSGMGQRYYPYERRRGGGPHESAAKHSVWVMEGVAQCELNGFVASGDWTVLKT